MANPLPPPLSALERRLGLTVGSLEAEDKARAEDALEDATVLALDEVAPLIAEQWEIDAPPVVRVVVLKAAKREYDNPRGLETEALGEHSVGISETSGVYLTGREVAKIRRAATGRSGGFVGSVRIRSAYEEPV